MPTIPSADTPTRTPALPRAGARELLLVALVFCVLTAAMTWPQVARPTAVPDMGDPLFSVWRLAWVAHQLPSDPGHLFDANIFHPERRTLAYSDAMLAPALATAPFLWLGIHPLHVYTAALLLLFVLSGVAMYALVRELTGERWAAGVAAVAFAFCPFRFDHYSHFELQVVFWMPLGLLAVHRVIERPTVRAGLSAGLAVAGQALSSLYFGIFFSTFLLPVGVTLWAGRRFASRIAVVMGVGAVVAALLILPVTIPYRQVQKKFGERERWEVTFFSADWASYVTATERLRSWNGVLGNRSDDANEKRLFPGAVVALLAVVALWPPVSRTRVAYGLGLATAVELSRGLKGLVYPYLYDWLLPFRGLRAPARFAIIVSLALAVLAGFGVARLLARIPERQRRWRGVAGALLALAVLVEFRPVINLQSVWESPPTVYSWFGGRPPSVIMEVPSASETTGALAEAKYLYFSVFHWQKLLTGISGFFPPSHDELYNVMRQFPDEHSLFYLHQRHVNYLVIHGAFCGPEPLRATLDYLDGRADVRLIGSFAWERSTSWLYEVVPPGR